MHLVCTSVVDDGRISPLLLNDRATEQHQGQLPSDGTSAEGNMSQSVVSATKLREAPAREHSERTNVVESSIQMVANELPVCATETRKDSNR